MKKQITTLYIVVFLSIVISVTFAILCLLPNGELSANQIYTDSLKNVVELKAESESVGNSYGTAEIIDNQGRLVTNAHVVTYKSGEATREFEHYFIRFSTETDYREVNLIKYDVENDIALLQIIDITGLKLEPIKIGDNSSLEAGAKVYAIGNAANYGIGIFEGIVSNPLVNIDADGVKKSVIQADLTIAAGNSGGALIDANGMLVGITTFRTRDQAGNVIYGIVYSLPINIVMNFVKN